uniref:SRCR domain-containing protein n=1 Tax=Myripristis murdjan TaxID=586833 RepID=A0A667ZFB0_9TELE
MPENLLNGQGQTDRYRLTGRERKGFLQGSYFPLSLDCTNTFGQSNLHQQLWHFLITAELPDNVRLVGGANNCTGKLEVKQHGDWTPVGVGGPDWNLRFADIVCRQLDCGSAVSVGRRDPIKSLLFWVISPSCLQSGSTLLECVHIRSLSTVESYHVEITCSESVRLVNGNSLCSGRVEVKSNQSWSSVCEEDFDHQDAQVVCRELGCGAPSVLQGALYGEGEAPVWSKEFQCEGTESALLDCRSSGSARNKSVESVRLMNGNSLCSGRVEVKSNQSWSSVCEDDFDHQDAQVVCRELGCGAPSVLQGALYGEGEAPVWSKEFQCEGTESALLHCRSSGSARNSCSPGKAVGLTCSGRGGAAPDNQIIRLVGGANHCAGRLQMKQHDDWRHVVIWRADWTLKTATVVCGLLDCGSAVSVALRGHSAIESSWAISLSCLQSGSTLRECSMKSMFLQSELKITCSGRVEVKSNQLWSSVCEDDFDHQDAQVVCRELGCGAPSVLQGALYGEGEALVWSKEFQCEGTESVLTDCGSSGSARKSCLPVEITCSEPDNARLVGGANRCAGRPEMKKHEVWRPVHVWSESDDWDLKSAAVICRQLDCGPAVSVQLTLEISSAPLWVLSLSCLRSGPTLRECLETGGSVRLVNGNSLCSGRMEVKSNQSWSSVCKDDFDRQDAQVVCRELGCGAPSVLQGAFYGEMEAPMWSKEFQCEGSESGKSQGLGGCCNVCICGPEDVRLAGEPSRCAGRLEMEQHGDWQPVIDFYSPWNLKAAAVVCGQLGCGSAVSTEIREAPTDHSARRIIPRCYGSESALRECMLKMDSASTSYILEVICSGNTDITSASTRVSTSLRSLQPDNVRLVGGANNCTGKLEVKQHGDWRPVSVGGPDWNLRFADIACRQLDCGSAVSVGRRDYGGSRHDFNSLFFWVISPSCLQSGSTLLECVQTRPGPIFDSFHLEITCSESVRLVNGNSLCSGRVEVKTNQSWSSVCKDDFDHQDAQVVCRELGCGAPSVLQGALYGEGEAPVWSREFQCEGSESALLHCRSSGSARNSCSPGKAVGLTCSGRGGAASVRLVNGSSLCSGRVEVKSNQLWSSVCEHDFDHQDAQVVCRELGCGAPSVLQGALYGEGEALVWSKEFQCEGTESALLHCRSSGSARNSCSPGKAVGLTCSGRRGAATWTCFISVLTKVTLTPLVIFVLSLGVQTHSSSPLVVNSDCCTMVLKNAVIFELFISLTGRGGLGQKIGPGILDQSGPPHSITHTFPVFLLS